MLHPLARYLFLLLFFGVVIGTKKMGLTLPILPLLIGVSFIVALIFEETLWHQALCPFGTMLHTVSPKAILSVKIDPDACISCGLCQKACPATAIITLDTSKRYIKTEECLICFECQQVCPTEAISYRK